jgi:hypothetical protein
VGELRNQGWVSHVLIPSPNLAELRTFDDRLAVSERIDAVRMPSDASPQLVRRLVRVLQSRRYDITHAPRPRGLDLAVAGVEQAARVVRGRTILRRLHHALPSHP